MQFSSTKTAVNQARTVRLTTMSRIQALKTEAMGLTDTERAALASDLLCSLPATLADEDEGVSEALRRNADLFSSPPSGISWSDIKKELGRE